MAYFKNFDHHMAALTHIHDMNVVDEWTECFNQVVCVGELHDADIRDAAITFASNLWRAGQEDYTNATAPEWKAQLKGCWERWASLFLKEASNLYPAACGVTISDIQQEVQGSQRLKSP